jgi:hypothetical protein
MNYLLIESAKNGNLEDVRNALNNGADIHVENDQALIVAAGRGRLEVVRLLLDRGANIHAQDDQALINAALTDRLEIVRLLLNRGADIHAQDDQALMRAASDGRLEVVQLLLDRGADIHAQDDQALGITAFHGYLEVAQLLIERGANINVLNQEQRNKLLKEVMPIIAPNGTERVIQDENFDHVCNANNDFEGVQPLDPILSEPIPSNLIVSVQSKINPSTSCFNVKSLWTHWITQAKKDILTERYASNPLNRGYFDANSVIYLKELLDREEIREEQESYKIIKDQRLYDQVMNSSYQELKAALNQDLFPKLTEQQIQNDIENITYEYRMALLNKYRESPIKSPVKVGASPVKVAASPIKSPVKVGASPVKTKFTLDFIFQYSASDLDSFISQFTETFYKNLYDKRYMTMYYLYQNGFLDQETEDLLVNNSARFREVLEISHTVDELRNRLSH